MADKRVFDDKLATRGQANLYDSKVRNPILNPNHGGQNGFRHSIAGRDGDSQVVQLHNDTKHLDSQTIAVLMQAPRGFESMDSPQTWFDTLKSMVEDRAETITGLKASLTVNFTENRVSGAGEIYEQPVNVLRERSEVEFVWKDIVGRPIQKFLTTWIEWFMMDPDTKTPKITMLDKYKTDAWTTEYQSMSVLFINLDIAHRYVDKAWLGTGMMPRTDGTKEGRRNYEEDAPQLELTIPFTGVYESTQEVIELAERVLKTLTYIKTDTSYTPLSITERALIVNDSQNKNGFQQPWSQYDELGTLHTTESEPV